MPRCAMMEAQNVEGICIKCNAKEKQGDLPNHIGSKFKTGKGKTHPLNIILEQAKKLDIVDLISNFYTFVLWNSCIKINLA